MSEQCPFCKSKINDGATVCASCGATKGVAIQGSNKAALGVIAGIVGVLLILIGLNGGSNGLAVLGGGLIVFMLFTLSRTGKEQKKPAWHRQVG